MSPPHQHNALQEAKEMREQLSSDKRRLAFLFGAGTSMAVGIDGIQALTQFVGESLSPDLAPHYQRLLGEFGGSGTVEYILDIVRLCRELLTNSPTETARGLTITQATDLDQQICKAIYDRVSIEPPKGFAPYSVFAGWVRSIARAYPVEVFTTNYDVLIERGLEAAETPHFDGFIGSYEPQFSAASVEAESARGSEGIRAPASWVRVWKLHGSIGWRVRLDENARPRIVRASQKAPTPGEEFLIYPSRQKYSDSRKQPYIAYHDRLRRFLTAGEALLVTVGYSFADQHINEIVFEGLRANNRLAVTALVFGELSAMEQNLLTPTVGSRNLTVYAANAASVGGVRAGWARPPTPAMIGGWPFWDSDQSHFTLGSFTHFAEYLRTFLGVRESMPNAVVAAPTDILAPASLTLSTMGSSSATTTTASPVTAAEASIVPVQAQTLP